jgi:CxxC motif-containing protein (DUF1111 family)
MNQHSTRQRRWIVPLALLMFIVPGLIAQSLEKDIAGVADSEVPAVGSIGGPDRALSKDESGRWVSGSAVFAHRFRVDEGLGPFFDGDACIACHHQTSAGGGGSFDTNVYRFGQFNDLNGTFMDIEGGPIASRLAVVGTRREELALTTNVLNLRNPQSLYNLGLIESIPDGVLIANEDPDDNNNDSISGTAARLDNGVGRFGWKAAYATVEDVVAFELAEMMGISEEELSADARDALVFYVSHLSPPPPDGSLDPATVEKGRVLFEQIGCANCHIPEIATPTGKISAYSDFLLHDVAPFGSRDTSEGVAAPEDYRTPPLWGVRHSAPYMHDGLQETLNDAIEFHFGEASFIRFNYVTLPDEDQEALITFLNSL